LPELLDQYKIGQMDCRALIFDLFGTLVHITPLADSDSGLKQMASVLLAPDEDFVASWHGTFTERMTGTFKNYQGCIRHICADMKVSVDEEQIELAAKTRFDMTRNELMTLHEGALDVLSHLRAKGCKTGLLSNCSFEVTRIWGETRLAPLIDVTVFSCSAGMMKPDPRIYGLVTEQLNVKPQECLYVADGIGQELATAAQIGMRSVQILIPSENGYDRYREKWNGPIISSLTQILEMIDQQ
jgi:putative hydrolase of the HAD superfamily